jgi:geranylgeranyl diphosphate synthase type II
MTTGPTEQDFASICSDIDRALAEHLPATCVASDLLEASRHAVSGPAKRVRSTLLVLTSDALGGARRAALAAASAVEFTHAASLVLDDLPAMDNASERRGKPATHVAFDEATAIISAIALMNQSFAVLAQTKAIGDRDRTRCVQYLSRAIGYDGLVTGQMLDLQPGQSTELDGIEAKHFGKTGALFAAALALGGAVAGADEATCERLWDAGGRLGVAFQGYDDLLDRHAAASSVGKPVGADEGKPTVATVLERKAALDWCALRLAAAHDSLTGLGLGESALDVYVRGLSRRLTAPLLAETA